MVGVGVPGYQPHTTRSSWSPWRLDLTCLRRKPAPTAGSQMVRGPRGAPGQLVRPGGNKNPFPPGRPRLPLSRLAEQMQDRSALSAEEV